MGSTDAAKKAEVLGLHHSAKNKNLTQRTVLMDEGLDIISEGLDTLKNLAHDMNEELDRQVPLIDEIDTKVDKATTDIKNNNVRLKENINKIRSTSSFFIDIILVCILLGIIAYLYKREIKRPDARTPSLAHVATRQPEPPEYRLIITIREESGHQKGTEVKYRELHLILIDPRGQA
ncbi:hypothetical protein HAX54_035043 [Datura stramonium]|uniref:t-SNARE coiled-coil homology domain-containing protein n=1 Tax=Datura stramonium TaxID=4076 RepID=A0ABS8SF33_DATST|nr:hypothetical protein [Datura stramonium]